jgi:hypothetical protein
LFAFCLSFPFFCFFTQPLQFCKSMSFFFFGAFRCLFRETTLQFPGDALLFLFPPAFFFRAQAFLLGPPFSLLFAAALFLSHEQCPGGRLLASFGRFLPRRSGFGARALSFITSRFLGRPG